MKIVKEISRDNWKLTHGRVVLDGVLRDSFTMSVMLSDRVVKIPFEAPPVVRDSHREDEIRPVVSDYTDKDYEQMFEEYRRHFENHYPDLA